MNLSSPVLICSFLPVLSASAFAGGSMMTVGNHVAGSAYKAIRRSWMIIDREASVKRGCAGGVPRDRITTS